ncbi:hypothetical protein [Streptomyces hokutonensis]|uniref:hypothetical protein n=1 Tax=Streptomyces hokutonensis TaxID=1306990 RepID=UPI000371E1F2|nr:hypothetical protein [Streptomyces hokutonensis]
MIGLVTQEARDMVAAAEALKGQRYREVEDADGGTRLVPARLGTAPLLTASDSDDDVEPVETDDVEADDKSESDAFKGLVPSLTPRANPVVQGNGAITQALAGHVYAAQRNARMPQHLADLQTTEPAAYAGPTFNPGTTTVRQQNHRAPTGTLPHAPAPGQVPFHTAPIHPGGQR